jgi:hypothetical protein
VRKKYKSSEFLNEKLPLLFSIHFAKSAKAELKISVKGRNHGFTTDFIRLRLRKTDISDDKNVVALVGFSGYEPPENNSLFEVKFSKLMVLKSIPEVAVNVFATGIPEKQTKIPDLINEDLVEPEKPKTSPSDYIIVLAVVFALLVLAGLACLYGIYVVKSGKSIADQRRMPVVSIPPMGASPYHPGKHFPRVSADL